VSGILLASCIAGVTMFILSRLSREYMFLIKALLIIKKLIHTRCQANRKYDQAKQENKKLADLDLPRWPFSMSHVDIV